MEPTDYHNNLKVNLLPGKYLMTVNFYDRLKTEPYIHDGIIEKPDSYIAVNLKSGNDIFPLKFNYSEYLFWDDAVKRKHPLLSKLQPTDNTEFGSFAIYKNTKIRIVDNTNDISYNLLSDLKDVCLQEDSKDEIIKKKIIGKWLYVTISEDNKIIKFEPYDLFQYKLIKSFRKTKSNLYWMKYRLNDEGGILGLLFVSFISLIISLISYIKTILVMYQPPN